MKKLLLAVIVPVLLFSLVAAGCESSFDLAARKRAAAGDVAQATTAEMTAMTGVDSKVEGIFMSSDGLTGAVVVKITAKDPKVSLLWAKIQVSLKDAKGNEVGTNNLAGALPVLIHLSSLPKGGEAYYVNDQIILSGTPTTADVIVDGVPATVAIPKNLAVSKVQLVADPNLGKSWTTTVTNDSGVRQETIIVQAIVRKGDKVVGTGTAIINGLDADASATVTGYFIGSSDGEVTVIAPPSNGPGGAGAEPEAPAGGGAGSTTGGSTPTAPAMTLQIN